LSKDAFIPVKNVINRFALDLFLQVNVSRLQH
jgi:hypothetical protein